MITNFLEKYYRLSESRKNVLILVVLFFICVFSYGNGYKNGFLLDDTYDLIGNNSLFNKSFSELFMKPRAGFYRPIADSFLKITSSLFGNNSTYYFIDNFILFYIVCALFYILLKELIPDSLIPPIAVILYALHPINNLLVNFNIASNISLYIIFQQLSILFLLIFLKKNVQILYLFSVIFFILGLLSHITVCFLPLYLFLILYFLKNMSLRKSFLVSLSYFIIFILCEGIIYYAMHFNIKLFNSSITASYTLPDIISIFSKSIAWYISRLFLPFNILIVWDFPIYGQYSVVWILLLVLMLAVLFYLFFIKKIKGALGFGLALFFVSFIPVIKGGMTYSHYSETFIIEPHWFAFSNIGFFIVIAQGCLWLKERLNSDKIWLFLIISLFAILSILTFCQNTLWKDEKTYVMHWIKTDPYNATPWASLNVIYHAASALERLEILDFVINALGASVHYQANILRWKTYNQLQQSNLAQNELEVIFEKTKNDYMFSFMRGIENLNQNNYSLALSNFIESSRKNTRSMKVYLYLGMIYKELGDYDSSIANYTKASALFPLNVDIYRERGRAYFKKKQYDLAIKDFTKLLMLDPESLASNYFNRGMLYVVTNQYALVVEDFTKILEMKDESANYFFIRSKVFIYFQLFQNALEDARKAKELGLLGQDAYIKHLEELSSTPNARGKIIIGIED